MISFSVSRLCKEDIRLVGSEPPEFVILAGSEPYSVTAPVEYSLEVSRVSGGALVTGRCETGIAGECGRCLAPVSCRIAADDIKIFVDIPPGTEICDISDEVRTEITLALPMNLLCRDDCRGLCPVCGGDLNKNKCSCTEQKSAGTSGVWSALDDLKF